MGEKYQEEPGWMRAMNRPRSGGSICKFLVTRSRHLQGASACCANSPFVVFVKALLAIDGGAPFKRRLCCICINE